MREVQLAASVSLAAGARIQSRFELREFLDLNAFRMPEKPGLGFTISDAVIKEYGIPIEKAN